MRINSILINYLIFEILLTYSDFRYIIIAMIQEVKIQKNITSNNIITFMKKILLLIAVW